MTDAERLRHACQENALADHVAILDEVGSTQDAAFDLARERGPTLVLARHQAAGRGRRGRPWHERPGLGLACTLALPTDRVDPVEISPRVAVACALAIERAGLPHARIKWPNDILDEAGRKLAGVLIEIRDAWALIGTGINVLHQSEDFAEELRDRSVSLAMRGVRVTPIDLAEHLVAELRRALDEPPERILAAWRARDALLETHQTFSISNRSVTGVVESIDPFREILVRTADGPKHLDARLASLDSTQDA